MVNQTSTAGRTLSPPCPDTGQMRENDGNTGVLCSAIAALARGTCSGLVATETAIVRQRRQHGVAVFGQAQCRTKWVGVGGRHGAQR